MAFEHDRTQSGDVRRAQLIGTSQMTHGHSDAVTAATTATERTHVRLWSVRKSPITGEIGRWSARHRRLTTADMMHFQRRTAQTGVNSGAAHRCARLTLRLVPRISDSAFQMDHSARICASELIATRRTRVPKQMHVFVFIWP